jgi:hypothetical protein
MDKKEIGDLLTYCMYICSDEKLTIELNTINLHYLTNTLEEKHIERLKKIEIKIQKEFR